MITLHNSAELSESRVLIIKICHKFLESDTSSYSSEMTAHFDWLCFEFINRRDFSWLSLNKEKEVSVFNQADFSWSDLLKEMLKYEINSIDRLHALKSTEHVKEHSERAKRKNNQEYNDKIY